MAVRQIPLAERIAALIAPLIPERSAILIGLSGGVDSVVLLHLLRQLATRYSWQLSAVHVHHGLSPNAGAWSEFCAGFCASLQIPLSIVPVDIEPLRAHGIEAAARKLRHRAFASQPSDFVALAHHADDQAETLLLQLLRGAGVRGAASMPVLSNAPTDGTSPRLLRPLLTTTREEILGYAAEHRLQWINDESNADASYPRNFLRHEVLPALAIKFPAYRDTLTRSAQHFAEASTLLDELAQQDGVLAIRGETLAVTDLQTLSAPRARNLLRYFLIQRGASMPQTVQLEAMMRQLCSARPDAAVRVGFGAWQVRRYQGKVYVLGAQAEFDPNLSIPWQGETELYWPAWPAQVRFTRVWDGGISLAKLQAARVTLSLRKGGETLRPRRNSPTRTLKNLLQECNIPPWQRDRLPLLFCGDELACVPGVAIDADFQAMADEAGVLVCCE